MTRMEAGRIALVAASLMLGVAVSPSLASITDATATSSLTLGWTAPGDDGGIGTASGYDLRYSTDPITTANFAAATLVSGLPAPSPAGSREHVQVTGLEPGRLYYFALKAVDDDGNWSLLSNVAIKVAPALTKPSALLAVSLSAPRPSPARDGVRIEMTLPREMVARVSVLDVGGRVVKWLAGGSYPAGTTVFQWDLTNGTGARLGAGQYWVLGLLGDNRFVRRLTVVP